MSSKIGRPASFDLLSSLIAWCLNTATSLSSPCKETDIRISIAGSRDRRSWGRVKRSRLFPASRRRNRVVEAPVEQRIDHRQFAHPPDELRHRVLVDRHLPVT